MSSGNLHTNPRCKRCRRIVHKTCVKNLELPVGDFMCSMVVRHLGLDGVEIIGPRIPRENAPINRSKQCLICGLVLIRKSSECLEKCGYSAHDKCIKWNNVVKTAKAVTPVSDWSNSPGSFRCSDVLYQIKPSEVSECENAFSDPALTSAMLFRLVKKVRAKGKVNTLKYAIAAKRYINEEYTCNHCNQTVDLSDLEHETRYCPAILGTPITDANRAYPLSKRRKLRHIFSDHYI